MSKFEKWTSVTATGQQQAKCQYLQAKPWFRPGLNCQHDVQYTTIKNWVYLLTSRAGCWESTFVPTYGQVHRQPTRESAPPSLERPLLPNLAAVELSQTFDYIVLVDCCAFAWKTHVYKRGVNFVAVNLIRDESFSMLLLKNIYLDT